MKHKKLPQLVARFVISRRLDQLIELTRYEIADGFGINPNYLSEVFKGSMGRTLLEFINFEKMKRAEKQLIECENLTAADISEITGFAKYDQFRRTFKNVFGLNPGIYKKVSINPAEVQDMKFNHIFESVASYIITLDLYRLSQLTREDVAHHFDLNKNYLGDIFKEGVKKTVGKFIEFEKIKRAEKLIITRNDLDNQKVAQLTGIPNYKRFKKKFKAIYGLCPDKYRLLNKT